MNLSNPVNATISDDQEVGTIVNHDAPVLLIDEITGRALALDSMIPMRDPFSTFNQDYFAHWTNGAGCHCLFGGSDSYRATPQRTSQLLLTRTGK